MALNSSENQGNDNILSNDKQQLVKPSPSFYSTSWQAMLQGQGEYAVILDTGFREIIQGGFFSFKDLEFNLDQVPKIHYYNSAEVPWEVEQQWHQFSEINIEYFSNQDFSELQLPDIYTNNTRFIALHGILNYLLPTAINSLLDRVVLLKPNFISIGLILPSSERFSWFTTSTPKQLTTEHISIDKIDPQKIIPIDSETFLSEGFFKLAIPAEAKEQDNLLESYSHPISYILPDKLAGYLINAGYELTAVEHEIPSSKNAEATNFTELDSTVQTADVVLVFLQYRIKKSDQNQSIATDKSTEESVAPLKVPLSDKEPEETLITAIINDQEQPIKESDQNQSIAIDKSTEDGITLSKVPLSDKKLEESLISAISTESKQPIAAAPTASTTSEPTANGKQIFKAVKTIAPWLWGVVLVVVILPLIGKIFITQSFQEELPQPSETPALTARANTLAVRQHQQIDWTEIEFVTKKSMQSAREKAEDYASIELNGWTDDLVERLDNNFLNWYLGYFNQKQLQYKSFFTGISSNVNRWLNPNSQAPQEKIAEEITKDFQTEFVKRVLVPKISQLKLESIANKTAKRYLNELNINFSQIPKDYQISQADWERYLTETAIDITNIEGKIIGNLSLKQITTGGAYVALKPVIVPLIPQISSAIAAKLAGKTAAKLAAKTGTAIAGQFSGAILDCTVGVGIILWDIWETNHNAAIEKPILRENLIDYIQAVKDSLLTDPNKGLISIIDQIDSNILKAIDVTKSVTHNQF